MQSDTHTLKMTRELSFKSAQTCGASSFIFQYGQGPVQKFACVAKSLIPDLTFGTGVHTLSFVSPSFVSTGTLSENTPESRYDCQRATIVFRCWCASAFGRAAAAAS